MGDPDRVGVNIPGHREAVIVMGNRQAVDTRLSLVCLDTRAAGNVSRAFPILAPRCRARNGTDGRGRYLSKTPGKGHFSFGHQAA